MLRGSGSFVLAVALAVGAPSLTATAQSASETDEEQALVLFRRARAHFESGEFERATVLLEEAIALHDIAPLHFNLGRSLEELGRLSEARLQYETFLAMEPSSDDAPRVRARISELDARIAAGEGSADDEADEVEVPPSPPTVSTEGPAEPEPSINPLPWIIAGVGAATIGAGVGFGLASNGAVDDSRTAADHRTASGPANDAETFATAANVLFIAGGALALAGLVWGLIDLGSAGSDRVRARVTPFGIDVSGSF